MVELRGLDGSTDLDGSDLDRVADALDGLGG
jgi:hypothetical protein